MTITLDDLEAEVWTFAVESTPERMDALRQRIEAYRLNGKSQANSRTHQPAVKAAEPEVISAPEFVPDPPPIPVRPPVPLPDPVPDDFTKMCSGCHRTLTCSYDPARTNFTRDRATPTGFRYRCKDCTRKTRQGVSQS